MRRRTTQVDDSITFDEAVLCEKVANDSRLLKEVLNIVRTRGEADHRFDVNLAEGKVSEELVKELLNGDRKVEVKRQYRVGETGRVLIEYAHRGGKKLTGISTTESDWYALVLDGEGYQGDIVVFITTNRLKRVMKAFGQSNKFSGRKGYSNFKLISLADLLATDQEITLCTPQKRKSPVKKRSNLD